MTRTARPRRTRPLPAWLLLFACAACAAGEPAWFESLDLLIGAQPGPGRAEVERRLQETRDPAEQRWLRVLAAQAYAEQDPGGAMQLFAAVEREARAVGDDDLLVLAVSRHALLLDANAEASQARTLIEQLRRELGKRGKTQSEARLLRSLGILERRAGEVDRALDYFEQALALDAARGDDLGEAASRNLLASLQVRRGQFFEAIQNHSRALGIFRAAGRSRDAAQTLRAIAGLYLTLRDYAQADATAVEMLATLPAEAVGGRVTGLSLRAQAMQAMGEFGMAEAHARGALALAESRGGLPSQSEALRTLARVLVARGQGEAAVPIAEKSLALSLRVDGSRAQLEKRLTLAAARHAAAALPQARSETEAVLAAARQQKDAVLERDALELLSRVLLAQGDAAAAFALRLRYEDVDAGLDTALASRRIADLITGLETDRQRTAIELLEKDNRIQALDLTRSRWTLIGLSAIAALVAIVAVVFFLRARFAGRVAALTRARHRETEAQHAALRAAHEALERNAVELERVASHDALTGLWNRHALGRRLASFLDRGRDGASRALMLIDVDHFKSINDNHGHHVGDAVLCEIARRMRDSLAADELLGRWGGEEFLVACRGPDEDYARALAAQLVAAIHRQPIVVEDASIPVTISVGAVLLGVDAPIDLDLALRDADAALYRAKRLGRDRVEVIVPK
ncbi:MAG: GGDEF domain-containing protein [Xanthomonadales bacterium]|nr:GGDEF domain-containing protein [Xanthomonadales bacterium]